MTRFKQNREFGYRGNARLERPIPGSIVADPLPATSELLPTAETALLETLGIATQALARACAQADFLPHATTVRAAQTPAADDGAVRTIEPRRRDPIVGGVAGGDRFAEPCPETDKGQTVFVYCTGCKGLPMLALDRAGGVSGDRSPTRRRSTSSAHPAAARASDCWSCRRSATPPGANRRARMRAGSKTGCWRGSWPGLLPIARSSFTAASSRSGSLPHSRRRHSKPGCARLSSPS